MKKSVFALFALALSHFGCSKDERAPAAALDSTAVPPGAVRQAVIGLLSRQLEAHYVYEDLAREMSKRLAEKAARGGYDAITDKAKLAKVLTADLRAVSDDKHLEVLFGPIKSPPPPKVGGDLGIGSLSRLPGNVALLAINGFVPLAPGVTEGIAARVSELADADAVILDLRKNGGGSPETVAFIESYFFEPTPLLLNKIYRRDTNHTDEYWNRTELPGKRFGGTKPLYVLTSARTFSGGEDLAYTMQANKRAIVIGEVTAGGAHPSEPYPIDAELHVVVPWGRSVSPITNGNWEGTGVKPDLPSPADKALDRALQALNERQASAPPASPAHRAP